MFNLQQLLIKNGHLLKTGETTKYGLMLEKYCTRYSESDWDQMTYQKQLLGVTWNKTTEELNSDIMLARLRIHHRKVDEFLFGGDIVNV